MSDESNPASGHRSTHPISPSTDDPKVLDLAKSWLRECVNEHPICNSGLPNRKRFYPTRLIDLSPFGRDSGAANDNIVRLVSSKEKKEGHQAFHGHYVTLSHCWGKNPDLSHRLVKDKLVELQDAILVDKLPLTFQHAIQLARCLDPEIRWIWIDAMCIIQDDPEDWLTEAAAMQDVYAEAFCNISATASQDSSQGMYRSRDVRKEWFSNVTFDIGGLSEEKKKKCYLLDLSFWNKYVQEAPVNRRSWVLQERLLSRRVLHMCEDQIAFECRSLDRAECRPDGLPHYHMLKNRLVNGLNIKKIDAAMGEQLRELSLPRGLSSSGSRTGHLQGMVDEPQRAPLDIVRWNLYENWKRIVEDYTKMELTYDKDRLIALSGIARRIRQQIASHGIQDEDYIAGMWQGGLAGQLLWYVNPIAGDRQPFVDLRPKDRDGAPEFRAPSFSWASVETTRGITYGEITYGIPYRPLPAQITDEQLREDGIYLKVKVVRLAFKRKEDNFGIIKDGWIVVKGVLRRVLLIDRRRHQEAAHIPNGDLALVPSQDTDSPGRNAWAWRLVRGGNPTLRENSIVWLDSPATEPSPFGPNGNVFVIPVLRLRKSGALYCLLVQLETTGDYGARYRRIGLTKISDIHIEFIKDILVPPGNRAKSDAKYYWGGEDQPTGESTICIF